MAVMIGIDPHKALHTAAEIDGAEVALVLPRALGVEGRRLGDQPPATKATTT